MKSKALAAFLLACAAAGAAAQEYPSRPIRMIVPAGAGGPTDAVARGIAPRLAESLGQPVVIDNRAGASGVIGSDAVAKAAPDGYTLGMVFTNHATNPILIAKLPYDTLKDFAAVSLVGYQSLILVVHPSLPVKSVSELIALAKSQPGKLNYASGGVGTVAHLAGEMLKSMTGASIVHIAYKSGAPALTDTLGGQVPMVFDTVLTCLPHVRSGKLRALAVTSTRRSSLAPDLPTFAESGLADFEIAPWYGIVAPAGISKEISARLSGEIGKILRAPEVRERYSGQGLEPVGNSPAEFDAHIRRETARWEKILKAAGIRAE